jgi:hypothetical protein
MLILLYMEEEPGIPASEFARRLSVSSGRNVTSVAVKMRLQRREIKPFKYIGPTGLYKEADFDAIKDAYLGRHPSKKEAPEAAPAPEPKTKPKATTPKAKAKKPNKKN